MGEERERKKGLSAISCGKRNYFKLGGRGKKKKRETPQTACAICITGE